MEYIVYVLYSKVTGKTYTGYTTDLINRFRSHNLLGKEYTSRYIPWLVVYVEWCSDKPSAMKREKQLKSGVGRAFIKSEILPHYPS
jgi:putative endonuclease